MSAPSLRSNPVHHALAAPSPFILRTRTWRRLVAALAVVSCVLGVLSMSTAVWAKPIVHTVYEGQRLGSIAKRYNVTVEELCRANNIKQNAPIKPGQKLVIPGTDDGKGDDDEPSRKENKESAEKSKDSAPTKPAGKASIHVVAKGHTLGAISGRYAVTVSAICNANGIDRNASLSVGQKLIIPHKTDKDGAYAKKERQRGKYTAELSGTDSDERENEEKDDKKASKGSSKSWVKYEKPAWRRGYIKIRRYERSWEGYVIGPSNEVLGHASNKINFVMGARTDGPRIDPKLIRLIASISDNFGGREMRIVSGYRTKSFVAASKHKQGKAIDFSIPGIPNEALRDYLRTIDGVGVGYYPNSSFVHLDVRGYNSYWIDHSGPGEAPRKSGKSKKKPKSESHDHDDESSGDESDEESDDEGEYDPEADKEDDGSEPRSKDGDEPPSKGDGDNEKSKDSSSEPSSKDSTSGPKDKDAASDAKSKGS